MSDDKEPGFEESMKALEEMVKKLENGGLDLDESLKIYEEAIALRDHCKKILEESDRKVQVIMNGTDKASIKNLELDD